MVEGWGLTFGIRFRRFVAPGRSGGAAVFIQILASVQDIFGELFHDIAIEVRANNDAQ